MKKAIIGIVAAIAVLWIGIAVTGFNRIVEHDEDVIAAFSEVQNQYQRRADLVPNLVEVVKGASDFEKDTLTAVTEARAKVGQMTVDASVLDDPARFKQWEQAQGELSGALSRLMVVAERYPELRATQAYRDLMTQLEGTENRITVARKRYIEAVGGYNKMVRSFPTSIGASMRGLDVRPNFEATTPGADQAPKVEF
jgi:LemA protein